jgi:hypothetical protein
MKLPFDWTWRFALRELLDFVLSLAEAFYYGLLSMALFFAYLARDEPLLMATWPDWYAVLNAMLPLVIASAMLIFAFVGFRRPSILGIVDGTVQIALVGAILLVMGPWPAVGGYVGFLVSRHWRTVLAMCFALRRLVAAIRGPS